MDIENKIEAVPVINSNPSFDTSYDGDTQQQPYIKKYDAESIYELQSILRGRLVKIKNKEEKNSLRKIGLEINVSHTYLAEFRDGKAVSMNIMNRLAAYFSYKYRVENYDESKLLGV